MVILTLLNRGLLNPSSNFINMYLQICGKEWSEDDLQILRLVNYLVHPTSWICDPTDTDHLLLQRNDVLKPKTLLRYLFREVQAGMTQSNVEQEFCSLVLRAQL